MEYKDLCSVYYWVQSVLFALQPGDLPVSQPAVDVIWHPAESEDLTCAAQSWVDKEACVEKSTRCFFWASAGKTDRHWIHQHSQELKELSIQATGMEPIPQTAEVADARGQRRDWRFVAKRGASSQFVGSTIMVLSTYAVATLTMNFGKNIQERRLRPNRN